MQSKHEASSKFKRAPHVTVEDILKYYVDPLHSEPLELEIRFSIINPEIWKNIYQKIISEYKSKITGKISESITASVSKEFGINDRKEIYFEKGVKTGEKYVRKKQIFRVPVNNDILGYKISLASETETKEFNIQNTNDLRIRLRSSLILTDKNGKDMDWQIDFTFVKSLKDPSQFQNVNKYRDKIFPKNRIIKVSEFLKHIDDILKDGAFGMITDPQISFELELEYIGKKLPLPEMEASLNQAIKFIANIASPGASQNLDYHEKLYEIAKILLKDQDTKTHSFSDSFKSEYVLKQLVNQPVNFDQLQYVEEILPKIDQYYLSDKADGDRCLVYIISDNKIYILTSTNCIDASSFVTENNKGFDATYFNGPTILDTEIIGLSVEKSSFDKIYVFDILCLNGEKLTSKSMQERDAKLDIVCSKTGKNIQKKIMVRLSSNGDPDSDYRIQIKKIYDRASRLYPVDGLIFTPNFSDPDHVRYNKPENYFDMVVYKWKPPERVTIDFLVMKAPKKLIGIKPYLPKEGYDLYFLFCGIKYQTFKTLNMEYIPEYKAIFEGYKFNENYFPIQFSPSINPYAYIYYHPLSTESESETKDAELNGHVAEFKYDCRGQNLSKAALEKNACLWILDKLRPDRDINVEKGIGYGNDFKTAESTYVSYQDPFFLETLINPKSEKIGADESSPYFLTQKLPIYRALTKFNAFVKAQLIRQLENSEWVIDLASGKGQDLFVYNGFGIKNCLFAELDKDALIELNRRKYEMDKKEFYVYNVKPKTNMSVFSKNVNLKDNYETLIELIKTDIPLPQKGVDGIVINFALHYIVDSPEALENFVNLVNSLLKPGGVFIFTCFNGVKIFNLLKNVKYEESWDLKDDIEQKPYLKYSIKKLYEQTDDEKLGFGKKISVIHPFSAGKYYEENILNIDLVLDSFKDKGFILRQNGSFIDWLSKFKRFNNKLFESLTKNDILYSSLYQYCSLWKPI